MNTNLEQRTYRLLIFAVLCMVLPASVLTIECVKKRDALESGVMSTCLAHHGPAECRLGIEGQVK